MIFVADSARQNTQRRRVCAVQEQCRSVHMLSGSEGEQQHQDEPRRDVVVAAVERFPIHNRGVARPHRPRRPLGERRCHSSVPGRHRHAPGSNLIRSIAGKLIHPKQILLLTFKSRLDTMHLLFSVTIIKILMHYTCSGKLHSRSEPEEAELHGWVRVELSGSGAPQGCVDCVDKARPQSGIMPGWVLLLVQ